MGGDWYVLYSSLNVTESGSCFIPVLASSTMSSPTSSLQNATWIFKLFLPLTESHWDMKDSYIAFCIFLSVVKPVVLHSIFYIGFWENLLWIVGYFRSRRAACSKRWMQSASDLEECFLRVFAVPMEDTFLCIFYRGWHQNEWEKCLSSWMNGKRWSPKVQASHK